MFSSSVNCRVKEEDFWKNYFYRVSLIKQATQLKALTNETRMFKDAIELRNGVGFRSANSQPFPIRQSSELHDQMSDINDEFVSEDCDASAIDTDDVRREIEQFSTGKKLPEKGLLIRREFDCIVCS